MTYEAPYKLVRGQIPLPEGEFVFHLHTSKDRFLAMLGLLMDAPEALGFNLVDDYNIDVINSLGAWDREEIEMPVIGEIRAFWTDVPPSGWLEMNGTSYNKDDYRELYNVLPETAKITNGQFLLPNMRNNVLMGGETDTLNAVQIVDSTDSAINASTSAGFGVPLRGFFVRFAVYAGR